MRATAERLQPGPGTGVGIVEAPEAGEVEFFRKAQDEVDALYLQPDEWSRKAVLNALGMGTFSSDRSIREYAERIWRIKPVL